MNFGIADLRDGPTTLGCRAAAINSPKISRGGAGEVLWVLLPLTRIV